jgi:hypothetical protein
MHFYIFAFSTLAAINQNIEEDLCVIDQCDEKTCLVETPEGWVELRKRINDYEGRLIECPVHLVEPT